MPRIKEFHPSEARRRRWLGVKRRPTIKAGSCSSSKIEPHLFRTILSGNFAATFSAQFSSSRTSCLFLLLAVVVGVKLFAQKLSLSLKYFFLSNLRNLPQKIDFWGISPKWQYRKPKSKYTKYTKKQFFLSSEKHYA